MATNKFEDYLGKGNFVWFMGVVEDNFDPLALGRCKVRCFGFHPVDREKVPTIDLPWATVIQPATSASTSGVGFSPNGLKADSWVMGFFADGETAQFPIVIGSIPRIHAPSASDTYIGNSGAGYHTDDSIYSGNPTPPNPNSVTGEFYPAPQINPSGGSAIRDDGSHLTKQNISAWPLKVYKWTPARGDYGLACKDAAQSLKIHYASALALEELGRRFGTNPKITSAYRTPAYNASVGGAKSSQHIQGRAFDIPYSSIGGSSQGNLARFAQAAVQCGFVGFGLYKSFIHIDTGSGRTWNGASAAWFVNAIKQAGWYPGKPGLQDVRTSNTQTSNNGIDTTTTGSTTTGEPTTTAETYSYMDERMKAEGMTAEQRAAVLAHVEHESGFRPNIPGDGGDAYGLFQWNDRQPALRAYTGIPSGPIPVSRQMDFFFHEINGGTAAADPQTAAAGRALRSAGSVQQANDAMRRYERYAGYENPNGSETMGRLNTAQKYLGGATGGSDQPVSSGFADPTGSLPYGPYKGKPSTHHNAMGLNGNLYQPEIQRNNDARLTTFPNAGDKGTIGEPPVAEAPQYPYNFMYAGLSGHRLEIDDTPGYERVNFQHKSGSRYVIGAEGSTVNKSMGNMYTVAAGDNTHLAMGAYRVSAKDDIDMRSTSDITLHSDGTYTLLVRNDQVEHISGKKDILVADTLQIKAKRIIIEAENIDFVASGNITMEAGGDLKMRAGGTMATSASDTKMYSSGSFDADAGSLKWLEGEAKEIPEFTGKSTDLGTAPPRSKVEKKPYIRKNPDVTATLEDAMANYSSNDPTNRTA